MKKLLIIFIFLGFAAGLMATSGIIIKNPAADKNVYKGNDYMIKWDDNTNPSQKSENVKIRLFDKTGTTQILKIVESTPNDGEFLWTKTLINSQQIGDYIIRIKTKDNSYYGNSGIFHLKNTPILIIKKLKFKKIPGLHLLNKIIVHKPAPGSIYQIYKPISIEWDKNFGDYEFAHIMIHHIDGVKVKGFTCYNTGVSTWTPGSLYNNKPLYIVIKSQDDKFSGKSGNFNIIGPAQLL